MSDKRYRTIVADPPWPYREGWGVGGGQAKARAERSGAAFEARRRTPLPYASMDLDDICDLPVPEMAYADAHLYLWTTNRYLRDAFMVAETWGFSYGQTLVWAKTPMGKGPGGAFAQNAEYVLFCRRGSLPHKERLDSVWFNWKRTAKHSVKPDAMLDMVERVSPGPYVELFARRARFGWDYYGDQSLGTAELGEVA